MLVLDRFRTTAFADFLAFIAHLRHDVGKESHIGLKSCGGGVDFCRQNIRRFGRLFGKKFATVSHDKRLRTVYGIPLARERATDSRVDADTLGNPQPQDREHLRIRIASPTGSSYTDCTSPISNAR